MSPPEQSQNQPAAENTSHGDKLISVVAPCYNESEVIQLFYAELKSVLESLDCRHEIIVVDDGSTDDTLSQLNKIAAGDSCVRVCSLSRNFGHQIALTAGIDLAEGDAVIMIDADLQHPPSLIPQMIQKWQEGFDIVSALRSDTKGVSPLKKISSKTFYLLLNIFSGTHIPQGAADFCLLSRRVCGVLKTMRERHRFLRGIISWMGFKRTFITYQASERAAGKSKYTIFKMMSLATDAAMSFSPAPLKLAMRLGVIVTLMGFGYLVWILVRFLLTDHVTGWTSLICVSLILGGCQLLFIGLIGQYLAKIFEEVKGRPMYIVKQAPSDRQQPDNKSEQPQENASEQNE